jgi:hypothetical protein
MAKKAKKAKKAKSAKRAARHPGVRPPPKKRKK